MKRLLFFLIISLFSCVENVIEDNFMCNMSKREI